MAYGIIEKPYITVVIPVYNEEGSLDACVKSLRTQEFSPIEIIVVDDGSTDSSRDICFRLGVKVLTQAHKGPGAARNLGTREASGNIILFVDADMTFDPAYVSRLVAPIAAGEAPGSSHCEEFVANWENPWARLQTWFLGCPDRRRVDLSCTSGTAVYRAVRKDFFLAAGGFAENEGRADDSSLAARTGKMPAMVSGAVCYHRNIDGSAEGFLDARWRGRDKGSKITSLSGFAKATFIDHNPFRDLSSGMRIAISRREPLAVFYAAVFTFGFQLGLFSAYFRGKYLK